MSPGVQHSARGSRDTFPSELICSGPYARGCTRLAPHLCAHVQSSSVCRTSASSRRGTSTRLGGGQEEPGCRERRRERRGRYAPEDSSSFGLPPAEIGVFTLLSADCGACSAAVPVASARRAARTGALCIASLCPTQGHAVEQAMLHAVLRLALALHPPRSSSCSRCHARYPWGIPTLCHRTHGPFRRVARMRPFESRDVE